MNIKAVVFDYGQVISMPQDSEALDGLAKLAGVKREVYEPVFWSLRGDYDRGIISTKVYIGNILSQLGISLDEGTIDKMAALDMSIWKKVNPETVALMEEIKRAGLRLGILSNMPHEFLAWARETVPVVSLVDTGLYSCEANLAKPDEAIYRKLISLMGVENSELVFFDDVAENVEGARALGIEAFLWKDVETARQNLADLGLNLTA